MKLIGTKELVEALSALEPKLQANIIRTISKSALKAKALTPFKGAAISRRAEKAMTIQTTRGSKTSVSVGPDRSAYVERWLQKGTLDRETKKGWNRGSIRGDFKLSRAAEVVVDPIIDHFNKEMGTEIQKTLERRLKSTKTKLSKLK